MTPAQLALLWVDNVNAVTSTIIGATTMTQLKEDIAAFSLPYSEELNQDIMTVFKDYPLPF
jgi:aryl-alcohol dehydrogenase-like predicted oxidoreductase